MAGIEAVRATMQALRDGTSPKDLTGLPLAETVKVATRSADYDRWSADFLGQ